MGSYEKHFWGVGGGGVGNRLIASEKLIKVYLLWPLQGSVGGYMRDFCSHVFANPDRYTLSQKKMETFC